jgi:hypothetical protein
VLFCFKFVARNENGSSELGAHFRSAEEPREISNISREGNYYSVGL